MAAVLMPSGRQHYDDAIGLPLVGGKVYTYAAGTSTPQTTWEDADQVAPNTNPVILDARGEASIFWSGDAYKVVLRDALDNLIWTADNLLGADSIVTGKIPWDLPDEADGEAIPAAGSKLPYLSGGVLKIA